MSGRQIRTLARPSERQVDAKAKCLRVIERRYEPVPGLDDRFRFIYALLSLTAAVRDQNVTNEIRRQRRQRKTRSAEIPMGGTGLEPVTPACRRDTWDYMRLCLFLPISPEAA
jgi:hypothetical protein